MPGGVRSRTPPALLNRPQRAFRSPAPSLRASACGPRDTERATAGTGRPPALGTAHELGVSAVIFVRHRNPRILESSTRNPRILELGVSAVIFVRHRNPTLIRPTVTTHESAFRADE